MADLQSAPSWKRRFVFLPTLVVLVSGMVAGVVQSLRFDSRLPRVELDYGWYLNELRQRGDHAGFVHGMQIALAIDDGMDVASGEKLLGGAYSEAQSPFEASHHYRRAADLDPNDAEAQLLLGTSLLQLNRLDEALQHLVRARDLAPENPNARWNLGLAYMQAGQPALAAQEYGALVTLQPDVARFHATLALALAANGRAAEARRHCAEAVRLEPGNPQWVRQCQQLDGSAP